MNSRDTVPWREEENSATGKRNTSKSLKKWRLKWIWDKLKRHNAKLASATNQSWKRGPVAVRIIPLDQK